MSMDTEKYVELEHKISRGKSPNDEGPYYHHAFWESYKGAIKGKLFGVIMGSMVGALIGTTVVAAASIPAIGIGGLLTAGTAVGIVTAFTGAGLLYGMKEFGDVGRGIGGNAAQFYQHELREKTFIKGEVAELKEEINEVKALLKGEEYRKDPKNEATIAMANAEETNYRKTHYAKLTPSKLNTLAFWKVVGVGLAVGAVAGLLLATGGMGSVAAGILTHIVGEAAVAKLGVAGITAASAITLSALGASFGLNRDFFRRIADKTDLLFKGRVDKEDMDCVREDQIEAGQVITERLMKESQKDKEAKASALAEQSGIHYPKSETHFRDKVLPAAQRALLSFDHTRATPQ